MDETKRNHLTRDDAEVAIEEVVDDCYFDVPDAFQTYLSKANELNLIRERNETQLKVIAVMRQTLKRIYSTKCSCETKCKFTLLSINWSVNLLTESFPLLQAIRFSPGFQITSK